MKMKYYFFILSLLLLYPFINSEEIDYEFSELYQIIGIEKLETIRNELKNLQSRTSIDLLKMCIYINKIKEINSFSDEKVIFSLWMGLK